MGSHRAQLEKKVTELTSKTKLNKQVVQSLVEHYRQKCNDKGLDRDSFRDDMMYEFDIVDGFILDRIFRTFDVSANTQHLTLDNYVLGMAVCLNGSLEDKMRFCFNVYDLNGDGYITREEMIQFLKNTIVTKAHDPDQDDADESMKELTEMVIKKLDQDDHDGRVSYADFRTAVIADKLLLESLGQCLPNEKCRCQFLKTLGDPDMNTPPITVSSRRHRRHTRGARSAKKGQEPVKCVMQQKTA